MSIDSIIKEILEEKFGGLAYTIVNTLPEGEGILEDELQKKIGENISKIRKVMYKLYELGIVKFDREEVRRRWWIYKWKVNRKKLLEFVLREKEEELKHLVSMVDKERNALFFCPKCNRTFSYDEALFYGFVCPDDNTILLERQREKMEDIEKKIKELEELILHIRKELENLKKM